MNFLLFHCQASNKTAYFRMPRPLINDSGVQFQPTTLLDWTSFTYQTVLANSKNLRYYFFNYIEFIIELFVLHNSIFVKWYAPVVRTTFKELNKIE